MRLKLRIKRILYRYRDLLTPFIIFGTSFSVFTILIHETQEGITWLQSIYFSVVVATTVGFGEITPATPLGKIIFIIFILISLGTLTSCLTTISAIAWTRIMNRNKGKGMKLKNLDLLIVGFPSDTKVKRIITEFKADRRYSNAKIAVLSKQIETIPSWFEDHFVEFVHGTASDKQLLIDLGIDSIKQCLMLAIDPEDPDCDDYTTSGISMIKYLNKCIPIIAESVREDKTMFEIEHCDVIVDVSPAEMLVQELQDPGAIELATTIFSNKVEGTQQNIIINEGGKWQDVVSSLIIQNATAIGYKQPGEAHFVFTPKYNDVIQRGATVKCLMIQ